MVLAFVDRSHRQREVSAHAALGAAADARLLHDRRAKYLALERAGTIRAGTSDLRQMAAENERLVAQIAEGWASEAVRRPRGHVLGASNETTHEYQRMLEGAASELASRGDFMLGGKVLEGEADPFKYRTQEARHIQIKGAFRVQDEQPTRVSMKDAAHAGRNAWRQRMRDGGPILGHPTDAAFQRTGRPGGDGADVAARQYMHTRRIQDGPAPPIRARMHEGSRARMQFRL